MQNFRTLGCNIFNKFYSSADFRQLACHCVHKVNSSFYCVHKVNSSVDFPHIGLSSLCSISKTGKTFHTLDCHFLPQKILQQCRLSTHWTVIMFCSSNATAVETIHTLDSHYVQQILYSSVGFKPIGLSLCSTNFIAAKISYRTVIMFNVFFSSEGFSYIELDITFNKLQIFHTLDCQSIH